MLAQFGVLGQTRRPGKVAANRASRPAKCSGAWTGTIRYSRIQSRSDNKTVERVSGRGKDTRDWQMKYDYQAQIAVIESPEGDGTSIGKATITHNFTSTETIDAVEKNSCDRGKTWRDMRGSSKSSTQTTGAATVDASVTVGVNSDGTYSVGVGLPQIKGQITGAESSSFSGQCTPKEGRSNSLPPTETTIDGNSLSSDGSDRINVDSPNRISGSFTRTTLDITETITWNLQKCGAPLRLTDLKFEDMKFPNWNDWQEIVEQKGTVDGNLVKVKAKVLNASGETKYADVRFKETYKGDKWDGARADAPLNDTVVSVRVEPGEEKEVEMLWDSSGYAWYDDGRPRLVQRVKAELVEDGKKIDELTKNIKVSPKPLVLVHGLWSNWRAWESWQNILTTSHSYDWKAYPVGEKPEKGLMNTGGEFLSSAPTNSIFQNAQELGKYIKYAQEDRNAWHVDIVAHSMGGLISRQYINSFMPPVQDGRPQVAHLIMLGTPNMGSPCADVMDLAFSATGTTPEAIRQLKPSVVEEFNKVVTNRKGVKFSVLAGDPLPVMCKTVVWNDGVVPVPSAIWTIKDHAISKNIHTELTGTADFSSFVKPRLAIGPKGNHDPEAPDLQEYTGSTGSLMPLKIQNEFGRGYGLSIGTLGFDQAGSIPAGAEDQWSISLDLDGRETREINMPVETASSLGITFMAPNDLSVSLLDENGVVVGTNLTGSPEAGLWFRSIFIKRSVTKGVWKLRLENKGERKAKAIFARWSVSG